MTVKIPVEADLSGATSAVAAFRQEIVRTQTALKGGEFEVNTGEATQKLKALVSSADALRTALDKANDKRIGVDTKEAESALTDTRGIAQEAEEELRRLSSKKVGIDTREAKRALQELKHLIGDARYGGSGGVLGRSVDDAKKLDQYMTRVRRTQEFLSKSNRKPVSQAQAERFVEAYDKHRKHDPVLRRFADVGDWFGAKTGESVREKREMLRRIGRQGGGIPGMRAVGVQRFAGAAGGIVGGMIGGGNSGFGQAAGSMLGAAAGMIPGAGMILGPLVGAIGGAIGSRVDQAMGDALNRAVETANLHRALGETTNDFEKLRKAANKAGEGLGVTNVKAAEMMSQFARMSNYKGSEDGLGNEVRHNIGFSRGLGINEDAGNQFFAQMRLSGVTRNEQDSRRTAAYIAEAIGRGGIIAQSDKVLQAISGFVQQSQQIALRTPSIEAYASMMATGTAQNIPGLNVGNTANILSGADAAARQGGAAGDASKRMMLFALLRGNPEMSAFKANVLMQGGLFGTPEKAFGEDSISYKFAEAMGDTKEMEKLKKMSQGKETNFSKYFKDLKGWSGGNIDLLANMTATTFGLSEDNAKALLTMHLKDPGLGGLQSKLAGMGRNLEDIDPTAWGTIGQISVGSDEDRKRIAEKLRTGDGYRDLTKEERERLDVAEKAGGDAFSNELISLVSQRGMQMTEGDKALAAQVELKNKFVEFADKILPWSTAIQEGMLKLVEKIVGKEKQELVGPPEPLHIAAKKQWWSFLVDVPTPKEKKDDLQETLAKIAKSDSLLTKLPTGAASAHLMGGDSTKTAKKAGEIAKIVEAGQGYSVVQYSDGSVERRDGARNWRNNNAGNLEFNDYTKKMGAIGSDGRFAIFPTKEIGDKARESLIFEGKNYRDKTLSEAIARYAPSNENDTAKYQSAVLAAVGGKDLPMRDYSDAERTAILDSMAKMEGYKPGKISEIAARRPDIEMTPLPEEHRSQAQQQVAKSAVEVKVIVVDENGAPRNDVRIGETKITYGEILPASA